MKIRNYLIALFLFAVFTAYAQEKEKKITPRFINGTVKNAVTGEAVPFASVMVKGTSHGFSADSSGKFSLLLITLEPQTKIEISAVGYETGNFVFTQGDSPQLVCNLSPVTKKLDEVVVISYDSRTTRCHICGRYTVVRHHCYSYPQLRNNEVLVYPNPVPAGNNIQASVQLKNDGDYSLDLIDVSGRILWSRRMNISQPKQNISIPTQFTWTPGTYILRISGKESQKIYSGKILLQ